MSDLRSGTTEVSLEGEVSPRERLRVHRLARELRLTDQILSLDLDTVRVQDAGQAPAWTSLEGDRVTFAYNHMPKLKGSSVFFESEEARQRFDSDMRIDIAVWLGTNAHELGHVLFSPRKNSALMYRVLESDRAFLPGIAQLHNIVEDQRQERLLLARFKPWTGYLTAALGHHLVADDASAWLLMAGRTWLPSTVRAEAKQRMQAELGKAATDKVTRIVGEYQRLLDPGDTEVDEAWDLLNELHEMFADQMPKLPPVCTVIMGGEPSTGDGDGDGEGGAPATADEADGELDADAAAAAEADAADAEGADYSGGGDTDGDGDGNSDAEQESHGENGGGRGAGAGTKPAPKKFRPSVVKSKLRRAAGQQIEADQDARDDLDSVADAVEWGRPGEAAEGDPPIGVFVEPTESARFLHREVSDALLDLKDESEPGWVKRVDSGRLAVRRLLNPNTEPDEMFDRYDPGQMDASELDVVVLVDVSGSMLGQCQRLGEATYAINCAVDDLEGRCTVITYDSGPHRILYGSNDRPDGRMFVPQAMGGTLPRSALREAHWVLDGSDSTNRLLVILTDGSWAYAPECEETIKALRAAGVTTVMALLTGYANAAIEMHECEFGAVIDDPMELARLFRRVAVASIGKWLR